MAGAPVKAQKDASQLFVLFHQRHPVPNRSIEVLLQYGGHALCGKPRMSYRVPEFFADNFPE